MTWASVDPLLLCLLRNTDDIIPPLPVLDADAWQRIVSEAEAHGIASILYRRLSQAESSCRPFPTAWQALRQSARRIAAENLSFLRELTSILAACQAGGLDCVPLRGLALAEQLHGDFAIRPLHDLDFLIRREDLSRMAQTLTALGYQEIDRRPGFARRFSYTLEFVKKGMSGPLVEPHWTIAYPPFAERVDMAAIWTRRRRGTIAGMEVPLLSPTDLLLHLCFHIIHKGHEAPLLWFYELDLLIRQQAASLDWPDIVLIAQQMRQRLFLVEILTHTRQLFDSPVPESVLTLLTRTVPAAGQTAPQSALEERLVLLLTRVHWIDGRESFAQLLTIHGLRTKLRFAAALLFPDAAFMRVHYGLSRRPEVALWYVRRLLFLIREGTKGLLSLLFPPGRSCPSKL